MLQVGAQRALRRFRGATAPPFGTGPMGAPGGKRWISAADVLAWNAKSYTERDGFQWDAVKDAVYERDYAEDPLPLRDYQLRACDACNPPQTPEEVGSDEEGWVAQWVEIRSDEEDESTVAPLVFLSGVVHMSCGLGKSWVAAELIRRSRAPAVVLAPHAVSVQQWIHLLRARVTPYACTLADARAAWTLDDPFPDVVVATYHSLVRVHKRIATHKQIFEDAATFPPSVIELFEDRLLAMLMCESFGILILDEVHVAVAEHFMSAGRLRARCVIGLSGSLVREDERIGHLLDNVGPVLVSHTVPRTLHVRIVTVPVSDAHRAHLDALRTAQRGARSKVEHAYGALNPHKVAALARVCARHADSRILVFCDSVRAAALLHAHGGVEVWGTEDYDDGTYAPQDAHRPCHLMTGSMGRDERDEALRAFCSRPDAILVCTRICDAAINFPNGCVVVQYHLASGSRQQEVQRCGRGTRDASGVSTNAYHLVNAGTDEVEYAERRVTYMIESDPNLTTRVTREDEQDEYDVSTHLRSLATRSLVVKLRQSVSHSARKVPKLLGAHGRARASRGT